MKTGHSKEPMNEQRDVMQAREKKPL